MSRTVLITGCSRGIGLALVKKCVASGLKVIATCRNPADAEELKHVLKEGGQSEAIQLDVEDPGSIKRAFVEVQKVTPTLDMLINNAAIATKNHPIDPVISTDPEEILHLYKVNVVGPMLVTQTFLSLLEKRSGEKFPLVANVSSLLGSLAENVAGGITAYRCSKAALNMLTKNFAIEAPWITFVAVHPGWVQTDMGSANNRSPPVPPTGSAEGIFNLLRNFKHEDSGLLYDWNGQKVNF